jgi:hypothetical protein
MSWLSVAALMLCCCPLLATHALQPAREARILMFNHVGKTAGSSLFFLLQRLSTKNNFTLVTPRFRSFDALYQAFGAALKAEGKTVIHGHFGYPGYLGGDVAHISIVRRAVDRCVSMYNYKKFGPRPLHKRLEEIAKRGNMSLDECFANVLPGESPPCYSCEPQQFLYFCGKDQGICDSLSSVEMLSKALLNMHHYTIGLTEHMRETVQLFECAYPQFFKGAVQEFPNVPVALLNNVSVNPLALPPSNATRLKIGKIAEVGYDNVLYCQASKQFWENYRRTCNL